MSEAPRLSLTSSSGIKIILSPSPPPAAAANTNKFVFTLPRPTNSSSSALPPAAPVAPAAPPRPAVIVGRYGAGVVPVPQPGQRLMRLLVVDDGERLESFVIGRPIAIAWKKRTAAEKQKARPATSSNASSIAAPTPAPASTSAIPAATNMLPSPLAQIGVTPSSAIAPAQLPQAAARLPAVTTPHLPIVLPSTPIAPMTPLAPLTPLGSTPDLQAALRMQQLLAIQQATQPPEPLHMAQMAQLRVQQHLQAQMAQQQQLQFQQQMFAMMTGAQLPSDPSAAAALSGLSQLPPDQQALVFQQLYAQHQAQAQATLLEAYRNNLASYFKPNNSNTSNNNSSSSNLNNNSSSSSSNHSSSQQAAAAAQQQRTIAAVQVKQQQYKAHREAQYMSSESSVYSPFPLTKSQLREKRAERRPFLDAIKAHRENMRETMKERKKLFSRCIKDALHIAHKRERSRQSEELKKQRAVQKDREQRLAALKSNDIVAYSAMLKDCKSARLQTLLEQTAKWEAKLKSMIHEKRRAGRREDKLEKLMETQKAAAKAAAEAEAKAAEAAMGDGTEVAAAASPAAAPAASSAAAAVAPASSSSADAAAAPASTAAAVPAALDAAAPVAALAAAADVPMDGSSSSVVASGSEEKSSAPESSPPKESEDSDDKLDLVEEQIVQPKLLSGGELKPYQVTGIQWMVSLYNNHLNGILADEMGLGKTIQTIGLISYLMEMKRNLGPYLVIAPLSTLKNWRTEFAKWAPGITVVNYLGDRATRRAMWSGPLLPGAFHVVLTSYEYIINKHDLAKLSALSWKYIIIDEGHRVKNHQSKLSLTLAERYRSSNRLILSGTPLQNSMEELWALLNFLLPTIFDSAETFDEWFSKPFANQGLVNAASDPDSATAEALLDEEEKLLIIHRLHQILRPFLLRRRKADVLSQLPPKVEVVLKCALTPWQAVMYTQLARAEAMSTVTANGETKFRRLNNTFMQLRKIVNHPFLFELENGTFQANYIAGPDLVRSSTKFDLLHRMLPKLIATGHKILLFCQMTKVLDLLEDYFYWKGLRFVRLDGSSKGEHRSEAQDRFNKPDAPEKIFIMSTRAGGLGLNLQVADTVILFDSDWNPQCDIQAQDRAHRLGQSKEVRVFRLITVSPVEEQVLARAQDKLRMDQMVIQSGSFNKDNSGSSDSQRKVMLQEILRQEIKQGNDAGAPNDEEINRMMARSDDEFHTFQAMDKQIDEEDARVWAMLHPFSDEPCPGRFTTEAELPAHVRQVDVAKILAAGDEIPLSGKRSTARTDSYKDALSERDFMKAVQQGIDPVTYAKQKLARGKPAAPVNRDLLDDDDVLLNYSDVEEEEDEPERSPSPSSASDDEAGSVKAGSESDVSGINKRRKTANGHANTGAKAPKRPKAAPAAASSSVSVAAPRVKKPAAPRGRVSVPAGSALSYPNGRSSLPPVYDDESPLNYDSSSSERSDSYARHAPAGRPAAAAAAGSKRKAPASSGAGKARNNTLTTPSPAPFSIRIPLRSPPPAAAAASAQSPLPLPLHYSPLPSPLPSPSPSPLPPTPASRKPKASGSRKKKVQQVHADMDDVDYEPLEYEPLADDEEEQPPAPAPALRASASGGLKLTLSLKRSP